MKKIESMEELAPLITAQWKRGVITNAPFSAEGYRREHQKLGWVLDESKSVDSFIRKERLNHENKAS